MQGPTNSAASDQLPSGFSNPFCVLGVSADADGQTIQQAATRGAMERRLRGESTDASKETQEIERAAEALKDPLTRFQASLQWVTLNAEEIAGWASQPETKRLAFDPSLLASTDYTSAARIESIALRSHNFAVLACADAERLATAGDIESATENWHRGFKYWSACMSSDEFARAVQQRAKQLDDPRLTQRRVREEIDAIPNRLLSRPVTLASDALQARRTEEAIALVELVRDAPFGKELTDAALERVYGPIAKRINREIEALEKELRSILDAAPNEPTESQKTAGVASIKKLLDRFRSSVAPDLDQMLDLGDLPGLTEEQTRDAAANFLNKVGIGLANAFNESNVAKSTLQLAKKYADAAHLHERLEANLKDVADASLADELGQILERSHGNFEQAIREIQELRRRAVSDNTRQALDAIERKLSDAYAVQLFEQAGEYAQRGNRDAARAKLQQAERWARDPQAKAVVQDLLRRVPAGGGSGCLIPIVAAVSLLALAGIF